MEICREEVSGVVSHGDLRSHFSADLETHAALHHFGQMSHPNTRRPLVT